MIGTLVPGLLAILIAYLLGAIPFGYLLTRLTTGKDVRTEGSGNIGATNVLRAAGRGAETAGRSRPRRPPATLRRMRAPDRRA